MACWAKVKELSPTWASLSLLCLPCPLPLMRRMACGLLSAPPFKGTWFHPVTTIPHQRRSTPAGCFAVSLHMVSFGGIHFCRLLAHGYFCASAEVAVCQDPQHLPRTLHGEDGWWPSPAPGGARSEKQWGVHPSRHQVAEQDEGPGSLPGAQGRYLDSGGRSTRGHHLQTCLQK